MRKLRDELVDWEIFYTLPEMQVLAERYRPNATASDHIARWATGSPISGPCPSACRTNIGSGTKTRCRSKALPCLPLSFRSVEIRNRPRRVAGPLSRRQVRSEP